jgi:hypothetical protein
MKLLEGNQAQKRLHRKTQSKPSFTGSPIEERKSSETHETRLEIERAVKGTVGSNPTPSAIFSLEMALADDLKAFQESSESGVTVPPSPTETRQKCQRVVNGCSSVLSRVEVARRSCNQAIRINEGNWQHRRLSNLNREV